MKGYSFMWPAWSDKPYVVTPSGHMFILEVDGHIPYIRLEDIIQDIETGRATAVPAPMCSSYGITAFRIPANEGH